MLERIHPKFSDSMGTLCMRFISDKQQSHSPSSHCRRVCECYWDNAAQLHHCPKNLSCIFYSLTEFQLSPTYINAVLAMTKGGTAPTESIHQATEAQIFNDWISATPALWYSFLWGVDPPPEEWLGEDKHLPATAGLIHCLLFMPSVIQKQPTFNSFQ